MLSLFLIGCNSNADDVEFVESYTMSEPVKSFNLVLENQGSAVAEITYEISFNDSDVNEFYTNYYLPGQVMEDGVNAITIEPETEQTYGVTFDEDFPEDILDKMHSFTLEIYDKDGNEQKVIHVVEDHS